MPKYRALQKTYVDQVTRHEGEVFNFNGKANPEVLELVTDDVPTGMPPPDSTQPLLPQERIPKSRNENMLGGDPHNPGPNGAAPGPVVPTAGPTAPAAPTGKPTKK